MSGYESAMSKPDQPIKVRKLGPGSDADTLRVLAMLPDNGFPVVVDAGCGSGRQTLALAKKLQTCVHGVDSAPYHLELLNRCAKEAGVDHLITSCCLDMADIPAHFPSIDLLWSECAAYCIGFDHALEKWYPAIRPGGYAVISELSWLKDTAPPDVVGYLQASYPLMWPLESNIAAAVNAGFQLVATHVLSRTAWIEDYYEVLVPHARALLSHPEISVRKFAEETLKAIAIFEDFSDTYGYVFYVLKKP